MKWWLTVAVYFVSSYWRRLLLFGGVAALMAVGVMVLVMFVGRDSDRVEASQSTPEPPVLGQVGPAMAPKITISTKAPIPAVEPTVKPVVVAVKAENTPVPAAVREPAATSLPAVAAPPRIEVPIRLSRADNIGSLEFVLAYDPEMLELVDVKKGNLAGESLLDSGSRNPGRIWTALINPEGITGNGTVAVFTFDLLDSEVTESILNLESVYANDATTLLDLLAEPSHGKFVGEGLAITSPRLNFVN